MGNRRSDTLGDHQPAVFLGCGLWGIAARIHSVVFASQFFMRCGLWGIAARIHSDAEIDACHGAVACGESPLGYTPIGAVSAAKIAVACGESPLGYTAVFQLSKPPRLWLVGNRRSDTLARNASSTGFSLWLVGNRRSDTLLFNLAIARMVLWLVGNRRSDTLEQRSQSKKTRCGLWGIAARIHWPQCLIITGRAVACGESPLGYTILKRVANVIKLWLVGNRRSDTLSAPSTRATLSLWLVGNRRSDTLRTS